MDVQGLDLLNIDLPPVDLAPAAALPPILARNLRALAQRSPGLAARLERAVPAADAAFFEGDDGGLGLVAGGRTLASKRRPRDEGERLAKTIDPADTGVACVTGFGAGHHVRAIAERLGHAGVVVCYEPDLPLLRAVLERIDHSDWLARTRVVVCDSADDRAPMSEALVGLEGTIALGVKVIAHPASVARLGDGAGVFEARFAEVIQATKTQVATTLIQAERTLENLVGNAHQYANGAGIADLKDAARGRGAVVVSAGPSLAKNIELLADPEHRSRVVVVAVQTTLRTLLGRGIKPDFVVALDYHEISTRFYEGLTPEDVEGVTFVVEAKVNPAVLRAWPTPGSVRFVANSTLDELLGEALAGRKGELAPGATVAHLACSLARYLGCDPVVLIGQDLAFADHRYYADRAAIHDVWAGELSEVRTLESFEWERIARGKRHLRQMKDQNGGIVFSDEQMASYLAQFEQDFARDAGRGLTTINASTGGAQIAHTTNMGFAEALRSCAPGERLSFAAPTGLTDRTDAVRERLARVAYDAGRIASLSKETRELLRQMIEAQNARDGRRINELVGRVQQIGQDVTKIAPAFGLTQFINQSGVLNRVRADRQIEAKPGASEIERQRMQIERDDANVESIEAAATRLEKLLQRATRAKSPREREAQSAPGATAAAAARTLSAVVLADPAFGGMGIARDLGREIWRGRNALQLTIARLRSCARIGKVVIATPEPERVRGILAGDEGEVVVERVDADAVRAHGRGIGRSRLFSPASWRGTPGGVTCLDEALPARALAPVFERLALETAVVVGADWCVLDPTLADEAVGCWAESPETRRVVVSNAAPGLAPLVIDREVLGKLADASISMERAASGAGGSGIAPLAGHLATLASVVSYVPASPTTDPIGRDGCVIPSPEQRDAGVRAIADTSHATARLARVLASVGPDAAGNTLAEALRRDSARHPDDAPQRLTLEVNTGRLSRGVFASWRRGAVEGEWVERRPLSFADAHRVLAELARAREDAVVTLDGVGDPGMHPGLTDLVRMCAELRIAAVHVRTELAADSCSAAELIDAGATLVSVDLHAGDARVYDRLMSCGTSSGRFETVGERLRTLMTRAHRPEAGTALPSAWVLPRLTRCDATLAGLPDWYDYWTTLAGGATIDGVPACAADERLHAIPLPSAASERLARETLVVRSDLSVDGYEGPGLGSCTLAEVWRDVIRTRAEAIDEARSGGARREPAA